MIGKTTTATEAGVRASRTVQAKVRMPAALHRKLMRDAERSGQTLNAEILRRLTDSYRPEDTLLDWAKIEKQWRHSAAKAGEVFMRAAQEASARTEERLRRLEAETEERVKRIEAERGKGDDKTTIR